ncbi:hypothetical protein [Echinicola sp. 20G]|uniref:hypothetical protein n=1 Tax=Echinicola sp. 20G TaxID=2781961 RepID=UPI001911017E|nr:hypothetical protein [Echinicola sp. 20G]
MKTYIKNIILFILPMAVILIPMEIYLRDNTYQAKSNYLVKNKNQIEAIILGPSYEWRAIDPTSLDIPTASLAHEATAINANIELFEKYAPVLPRLKYVFFDLSLGYMENENPDKWEGSHLFNIYYDIKSKRPELKDNFLLTANFRFYFTLFCSHLSNSNNKEKFNEGGFIYKPAEFNDLFAQYDYNINELEKSGELYKRIMYQNTINDKVYDKNELLLKNLIDYCKNRNIQMIFISPPKFHLNNKAASQEIIERRDQFLSKFKNDPNVIFWNYENFMENDPKFFLDDTHLNPKGAEIFTATLNRKISGYMLKRNRAEIQ